MMDIRLLYLHKYIKGGAKSFVYHLCSGLDLAGIDYELNVVKKTSDKPIDFGYGIVGRSISPEDLFAELNEAPILIVSLGVEWELVEIICSHCRPAIIIHKLQRPANKFGEVFTEFVDQNQIIVIRKSFQQFYNATYIGHPYKVEPISSKRKTEIACCRTQVTFHKNIDIIQQVPLIDILGGCDRRYVFFNKLGLNQKYFTEKGFDVCLPYKFDVDLTQVNNDGGGTQYTFYEAANAKSVPILWRSWLKVPRKYQVLKEGVNVLAVSSAEELRDAIQSGSHPDIIDANLQLLKKYDAKRQAKKFYATTKGIWNATI